MENSDRSSRLSVIEPFDPSRYGGSLSSGIVFGGQDWWYHNRSHADCQIARQLSRRVPTLYINSITMQKPNIAEGTRLLHRVFRKLKSILTGLRQVDDSFWVFSPFSLPVHHRRLLRLLNDRLLMLQINRLLRRLKLKDPIVLVAVPTAARVAMKTGNGNVVYLKTDKYELFPNVDRKTIEEADQFLKRHAALTAYFSRRLYESDSKDCQQAVYLDHGVDFERFAAPEAGLRTPSDMSNITRPIAGLFGTIDSHTVDTAFIAAVARIMPECSFVLIGRYASWYGELFDLKNVYAFGSRPYEEIASYGSCFDVAFMAWQRTEWIRMCNPIKLKEYLALGKPVVSTPFPELDKYLDIVHAAETPDGFAACIRRALVEDNPTLQALRKSRVRQDTWEKKVSFLLHRLYNSLYGDGVDGFLTGCKRV